MQYRYFRFVSKEEMVGFEQEVGAAVATWAANWFGAQISCKTKCVRPDDLELNYTNAKVDLVVSPQPESEDFIAMYASGLTPDRLMKLLTGDSHARFDVDKSTLLPLLQRECLLEFASALAFAATGDAAWKAAVFADEPPDVGALWSKASGALVVCVTLNQLEVHGLVSPRLVLREAPRRNAANVSGLVSRRIAISNQRTEMQFVAGEAELELELLRTIKVGDVVKLNTSCEQPLQVTGLTGEVLCNAFLGALGDHRAAQLIREP